MRHIPKIRLILADIASVETTEELERRDDPGLLHEQAEIAQDAHLRQLRGSR